VSILRAIRFLPEVQIAYGSVVQRKQGRGLSASLFCKNYFSICLLPADCGVVSEV
jgi:hypothetical protein